MDQNMELSSEQIFYRTPKILVVIPTLNEEFYLEDLVHQLIADSTYNTIHFIIADGGSTDRTPCIAKSLEQQYEQVSYLYNPKKIQSAAINLAVEIYGSDSNFLIRLDAHANYPRDYCNVLVDEALRTGANSVVVSMTTVGQSPFQKVVAIAQNSWLGNGGSLHRKVGDSGCWVDHGHHALIRLENFRAVGGYDESFNLNEDAELDYRLIKSGCRIWLTSQTSITYYPRSSPSKLFKQYVGYGHGRARTIFKHGVKLKFRQILPACILPIILLALITPFFRIACLPVILWSIACLTYGIALAWRSSDSLAAWTGSIAIMMHTGWSIGFWTAFIQSHWVVRILGSKFDKGSYVTYHPPDQTVEVAAGGAGDL